MMMQWRCHDVLTRAISMAGIVLLLASCIAAYSRPSSTTADVTTISTPTRGRTAAPVDTGIILPVATRLSSAMALDAIAMVTPRIGWAAGDGILATTDGGRTWRRQISATMVTQLDAVDAAHAWAVRQAGSGVGAQPFLLRTTDGGQHWRPAGEPLFAIGTGRASVHPLSSVRFLSPLRGVGVTGLPATVGSDPYQEGRLVATVDGGETWRPVPTPDPVSSACFDNPIDGWAAVAQAGAVLRTTDGGRSWRRVLPDGPRALTYLSLGGVVACPAPGNVWALLYGDSGMMQQVYALYHSTDGGGHWRAVAAHPDIGGVAATAPPGLSHPPEGPAARAGALDVVDTTTAYLSGNCPVCGTGGSGTVVLGATHDGGGAWRNGTAIPGLDGSIAAALSFVTPVMGWLVVSKPARDGRDMDGRGMILVTIDSGRTWQQQYLMS